MKLLCPFLLATSTPGEWIFGFITKGLDGRQSGSSDTGEEWPCLTKCLERLHLGNLPVYQSFNPGSYL